jgi:hypothetical protein
MHKKDNNFPTSVIYTCNEYREEMVLLALQIRLRKTDLTAEEREALQREIASLEKKMGL